MTGEQYKKANKAIFPIILIILLYIEIMQVVDMLERQIYTVPRIIQVSAFLFCILLSIFGFVKLKETKLGSILIMTGGSVAYLITACLSEMTYTYVYAFPIIICVWWLWELLLYCLAMVFRLQECLWLVNYQEQKALSRVVQGFL